MNYIEKKKTDWLIVLLFWLIAPLSWSQTMTVIDPHNAKPTTSNWEAGYQTRLLNMVNARTYTIGSGNADPDDGKRTWTRLMTEMWKDRNNPADITSWINGKGNELLNSTHAGSFYKPFSVPGYTMYYLQYKSLLPQAQKDKVYANLYGAGKGWTYLTRTDGYMDPIYDFTEFNSENFNWMARMGGYLLAHDFNDSNRKTYFDNYIRNWIRALYNAGRLEWNSNNYWGHTFNPLLVLHHHAKDTEVKKMAKAGLDWMVTEAAVHYLDGWQAAGDVRAKSNAYKPFAGSVWGYSYFYFTDANNKPTYSDDFSSTSENSLQDFTPYAPYSSYRPPQVLIDIAQRKFALPVEIQSAKPFYLVDNDNYADWKGNTTRSRRFEFETIYMDKNYTLVSLASNRPDGSIGTYSEQSIWRFAVKGTNSGAVQVFGNAGTFTTMAGRWPHEEIGQFRNVMLRLIKNTQKLWVAIPANKTVEFSGNTAFVDMGNDVYLAFVPYNATGKSSAPFSDNTYTQYTWNYSSSSLGGLALEVGTKGNYSTFANFKTQVLNKGKFTSPATDVVAYAGANGHELKMQYMPTITYQMVTGQSVNPAGVTPKTWGDGKFIDYSTWNSYDVSFGPPIIRQEWGSGILKLQSNTNGLQIEINPTNAQVTYKTFTPSTSSCNAAPSVTSPANGSSHTAPATLTVSATATAGTGCTISKVEFYQGSTKIGEASSSPYSISWTNVPAGTYSITAKTIFASGETATSTSINVTVTGPSSGSLIDNISVSTGKAYTTTVLNPGVVYYIDRTYQLTSAPASVSGKDFIRTANDDKSNTSSNYLSFNLSEAADLYVAYDSRATSLPSWLNGWVNTGQQLTTPDVPLKLYSKSFASGQVTLGGNRATGSVGSNTNYLVVAVPTGSGSALRKETEPLEQEEKMLVFPNSASEYLNIKLEAKNRQNVLFSIKDRNGRTVKSSSVTVNPGKHSIPLDVQKLEGGMYFLIIEKDGKSSARKIFISK